MANSYSYQVISDSNKRTVIKLTGKLDANGETSNTKILGRSLPGALAVDSNNMVLASAPGAVPRSNYRYSVARIVGDVFIPNGYLELLWDGANSQTSIWILSGSGDYNMMNSLGVIQNSANGANGNIIVNTANASNFNSYSIFLELHKDARDFNQGQVGSNSNEFNQRVTP